VKTQNHGLIFSLIYFAVSPFISIQEITDYDHLVSDKKFGLAITC